MEDVRSALTQANVNAPKGSLNGAVQSFSIGTNDQLTDADEYRTTIISYKNNAPVRLADVAKVIDGVENDQLAAWANGKPAVLLDIRRQPSANIVQTVEEVRKALPELKSVLPADVHLDVFSDRTVTIRASVHDVEFTLGLTILLVIAVIFVFLRRLWATVIPSVAVPLSLLGTFGVMSFASFSLDNLSLMALTVATGFVVDDAIVMIENIVRYIEQGKAPKEAALIGASEIGFTIVSLTVSLIAVFLPLLLMPGVTGRLFHEFAWVLTIAVAISMLISLTLTPMMCAYLLKQDELPADDAAREHGKRTWWNRARRRLREDARLGARAPAADARRRVDHGRRHDRALHHDSERPPARAGHGPHHRRRRGRPEHRVSGDGAAHRRPSPQRCASSPMSPASPRSSARVRSIRRLNQGQLSHRAEAAQRARRARQRRRALAALGRRHSRRRAVPEARAGRRARYARRVDRIPVRAVRRELRRARRRYVAKMTDALRKRPELADVGNNLANQGNELKLTIDREKASRLGVPVQTIDDTLYDAFGQRQISTIFTQMNQYRVVLEVGAGVPHQRGPARQADGARQRQRRADRQQRDDARPGHVEQLGDAGRHRQHRQHRHLRSAAAARFRCRRSRPRSRRTRRSSSAIRISCRPSRSRSISRRAIRCRTRSTPCTRSRSR